MSVQHHLDTIKSSVAQIGELLIMEYMQLSYLIVYYIDSVKWEALYISLFLSVGSEWLPYDNVLSWHSSGQKNIVVWFITQVYHKTFVIGVLCEVIQGSCHTVQTK